MFPGYDGFSSALRSTRVRISHRAIRVGIMLGILQIIDGLMTATGIHNMGMDVEANMLMHSLMIAVGPFSALILAKLITLMLISFVVVASIQVRWAAKGLLFANLTYFCFAILPWSYLLVSGWL